MNPASTRRDSKYEPKPVSSRSPSRASSRSPSRAPSKSELSIPPSRSESLASITSVKPRKEPPLSATPSSKSVQRKQSISKLPPKKSTESKKVRPPPAREVSKKIKISASIKKRAKGRDKVPERFRDGCKDFSFSFPGILKILRMCLIAAAVFCFVTGGGHELFIAITIEETCIALFFIIVYLVTLHHLMICIHWPLLLSIGVVVIC